MPPGYVCVSPHKKVTDIIEFNTLPTRAHDNLIRISEMVVGVVPIEAKSWRFTTNDLQPSAEPSEIIAEVAKWAGKDFIYIYTIHLVTMQIDLSKIREVFSEAKSAKKNGRAYPRLNSESSYFYVGSSEKVSQRLRQHLGYGYKDTYALQLAHWANSFPLELEFNCAKYQAGLSREVYQALEDTLWEEMSPMFGRKGAK